MVVPVVLPGPTEEGEPPPAEAEGEVPLPLSRTLSGQVRDTLRAVRARHFHPIDSFHRLPTIFLSTDITTMMLRRRA